METSEIPTIADTVERAAAMLSQGAIRGMPDAIAARVAELFTADHRASPHPDQAMLELVVYGRACHEAAKAYRQIGEMDRADLYFAVGQDMLAMAAESVGIAIVAGVDALGIERH